MKKELILKGTAVVAVVALLYAFKCYILAGLLLGYVGCAFYDKYLAR